MGMGIGANDATNMMNKSSMVGFTQKLGADQQIKESDRAKEAEQARESDPESTTASNTRSVSSSSGAGRSQESRRMGQESRGLGRLNRGTVEWQDEEKNQGGGWLPPSLRPQSQTAGTANQFNIPHWLMSQKANQPGADTPLTTHRKLLNGLKAMVNIEIQQYVKANEPPYAKKTLREIYNVLGEEASASSTPKKPLTTNGEPAGLNNANWQRAQSVFNMLENPPPEPGEAFEQVA